MTRSISNLKRYLEMVPELSSRMLISYKHLTQGITNESYHLKFTKDEYVIKFFNNEAIDIGIDHKKEMRIMAHLEPLNVAPVVIYVDLDEQFSIARWIEGDYWSESDFDDPSRVKRLMQKVKEIHSLPTDDLPEFDLLNSINNYRAKIDVDSVAPELLREELLQKAAGIISASDELHDKCLCHNDLLASNILINDSIHFFDWEFSGVNSPLFELAAICKGNELNEQQRKNVLKSYFGEYWSSHERSFKDWIWLYEYVALLWELAVQKEIEEVTEAQHARLADLLENV